MGQKTVVVIGDDKVSNASVRVKPGNTVTWIAEDDDDTICVTFLAGEIPFPPQNWPGNKQCAKGKVSDKVRTDATEKSFKYHVTSTAPNCAIQGPHHQRPRPDRRCRRIGAGRVTVRLKADTTYVVRDVTCGRRLLRARG
jgi:hypothetical protein